MKLIKKLAVSGLMTLSVSVSAGVIETTSSWNGSEYINPFGEPNTATYGQTFRVGADNFLNSFTFYVNDHVNPDYIDFEAYVYAWDGFKASGSALFSSAALSTSNNGGADGMEAFNISTGSLNLITGEDYVAFFSTSNLFDGSSDTGLMGGVNSNSYADGKFVYMNNGSDFSQLTSINWSQRSYQDLAFSMNFSDAVATPVPESATLALLSLGLSGLVLARRRVGLK